MNVEEVLTRCNRLQLREDELYRSMARSFDMPETTFWVLYSLREPDLNTQAKLCQCLHQSKQSVNSALKRLETDGFVQLEEDPEKRTQKYIRLTLQGEKLAQRSADVVRNAELDTLSHLSDAERETMMRLRERYTQLLAVEMQRHREKARNLCED